MTPRSCVNELAMQTKTILRSISYCGIMGNERADQMARDCTTSSPVVLRFNAYTQKCHVFDMVEIMGRWRYAPLLLVICTYSVSTAPWLKFHVIDQHACDQPAFFRKTTQYRYLPNTNI